jgi:hypothetical protein
MLAVLALFIELPYRFAGALADRMAKADAFKATQAALLTLASFVLGLSFAQASARFDFRRSLVVREANAIGTTWLRADQLSSSGTGRFRQMLTAYTAGRLAAYEASDRSSDFAGALKAGGVQLAALWGIASGALRAHPTDLGISLLVQALNDTINVAAEQRQALSSHVPTTVVVLTLLLVTLGALSLGMSFALTNARPPILSVVYVVASVLVIQMMIDYDRPGSGFVTVNLTPLELQLQSMQGGG